MRLSKRPTPRASRRSRSASASRGTSRPRCKRSRRRNVIGLAEGSDPALKSEAVIFSAHWDHLGIGSRMPSAWITSTTAPWTMRPAAPSCWKSPASGRARTPAQTLSHFPGHDRGGAGPPRRGLLRAASAHSAGQDRHQSQLRHHSSARHPGVGESSAGAERTTAWPTVQKAAQKHQLAIEPDRMAHLGYFYRSDHFALARSGVPAFSIYPGEKIQGKPAGFARKAPTNTSPRSITRPRTSFMRTGISTAIPS